MFGTPTWAPAQEISSAHGIVVGNIGSRFTHAAYLPGIDYHQ